MGGVCSSSSKSKKKEELYQEDINKPEKKIETNAISTIVPNNNLLNPNTNIIQPNQPAQNRNLIIEAPQFSRISNVITNNTNQNGINNNNRIIIRNNNIVNNSIDDDFLCDLRRINNPNNEINRNTIETDIRCPDCRFDFNNNYEFERHFAYCNLLRNNLAVNNRINEILSLVQTLNQRVSSDSIRIPQMLLNEMNSYDKPSELIDWEYKLLDNGIPLWKNNGKIVLKGSFYL